MPKLQGLIFDLDGTLIDSAPDLRQALNHLLKNHGRRELTINEVKKMTGDGLLAMMERAFLATDGGQRTKIDSFALYQQFIGHYRGIKPDPAQIYPQARETLELFSTAKVKLGICTNKQEASTRRLLEQLELHSYFSFIAGGDTFPVHKPHPDHIRGVIENLGIEAGRCVMVGDGSNDVIAAQGAGIPCIVVAHGYGNGIEGLGADKIISGFDKLPQALNELGFQLI